MDFKVVFSAEGFDHTAYFDCAMSCDVFARMMANDGRLLIVKVKGLNGYVDITHHYVDTVLLNA